MEIMLRAKAGGKSWTVRQSVWGQYYGYMSHWKVKEFGRGFGGTMPDRALEWFREKTEGGIDEQQR